MSTMREAMRKTIEHKNAGYTPWNIELTKGFQEKLEKQTGCTNADEYLGNHIRRVKYKNNKPISDIKELDIFGVEWEKLFDGGDIGMVTGYPLKEPVIGSYKFPELQKDFIDKQYSILQNNPRNAFTVFSLTMCFFERSWTLRGLENILMDMCLNEDFAYGLYDKILEHHIKFLDYVLQYDFDGFYIGDDWGQQRGLIMGPKLWRKFIKPPMAVMFEKIKRKGKYVIVHSCGDNREILPDLIDIGLDVYNTVQPEIYDLKQLKSEYGKYLTFWGGVSTQQFLPTATKQECIEEAKRLIELMSKGGGYILAPTHSVTPDIPVDNVLALVETARSYI